MEVSIEEILSLIKRHKHMHHHLINSQPLQTRQKEVKEQWFKCTHEDLNHEVETPESIRFGTNQKPTGSENMVIQFNIK